ncbi:OmpA family protein [Bacteroidota bacterium]
MKKMTLILLIPVLALTLSLNGCSSASNTAKGGAIGAVAGGVLGGLIGKASGNTAAGAIIGAIVGGTAGAAIGNYMDRQAEEMEKDIEGATIERVGEGIKITFDSGILFATNSSILESEAKTNITNLSKILNKYEDTNILVTGHTDNTGKEDYNQTLSEKRAQSVANFTKAQGVSGTRFEILGLGWNEPVTSNETVEGRRQNRRVEIAIYANEELKEAAQRGGLN